MHVDCNIEERITRLTSHAVGNAMWRSSEGQTGISSRASNIFWLGLVVSPISVQSNDHSNACPQYIYALRGGELLIVNDYHTLERACITAEQEVVTKHFCYFGPVPGSFYQQIRDENWGLFYRGLQN